MIDFPKLSPNFTVDDIHKIREYNYEMTKNMTRLERDEYYRINAAKAMAELNEFRKNQGLPPVEYI